MGRIDRALAELERVEEEAAESSLKGISPTFKLIVALAEIIAAVSVRRGDLASALLILAHPLSLFTLFAIPLKPAVKRLAPVLPFVLLIGLFEPIIGKSPAFVIGGFVVTKGLLSMLSLIIKGLTALLAAYLLSVGSGSSEIFSAMRRLRLPKLIVTEIELIFRYLSLLLLEAKRISAAYSLRAPGQRGIAFKAWGPLLGQLVLRSIDRADEVYSAMLLRGFKGEYPNVEKRALKARDFAYLVFSLGALIALRALPYIFARG